MTALPRNATPTPTPTPPVLQHYALDIHDNAQDDGTDDGTGCDTSRDSSGDCGGAFVDGQWEDPVRNPNNRDWQWDDAAQDMGTRQADGERAPDEAFTRGHQWAAGEAAASTRWGGDNGGCSNVCSCPCGAGTDADTSRLLRIPITEESLLSLFDSPALVERLAEAVSGTVSEAVVRALAREKDTSISSFTESSPEVAGLLPAPEDEETATSWLDVRAMTGLRRVMVPLELHRRESPDAIC